MLWISAPFPSVGWIVTLLTGCAEEELLALLPFHGMWDVAFGFVWWGSLVVSALTPCCHDFLNSSVTKPLTETLQTGEPTSI